MEEVAIKEGFNNLRSGSDFNGLYQAAVCRSYADWIVGMNYSRLFSCLYSSGLSIGRVQTPTLAMIVERNEKIKQFVKEPFYVVGITGKGFTAESERLKDKSHAESIQASCDGKIAVVASIERDNKKVSKPKLFDLTTLQKEANKMFGYTAMQTLDIAQNLYEAKILTYPRTDSRFITEDMESGVITLVKQIGEIMPFHIEIGVDMDNYNHPSDFPAHPIIGQIVSHVLVNNAKVTDHHAILPTPTAVTTDIAKLSTEERNIFFMVCSRLLSSVAQDYIYYETVVTVDCEGERFTAKGKETKQEGWRAIERAFAVACDKKKDDDKDNDKILPHLAKREQYTVQSTVREGFTSPPKYYTEATLLSAMESAGVEDMPDDAERKGIGTPATRASIIERLITVRYIERNGKNLLATEKGVNLIKILPEHDSIKTPLLTAEWENEFKNIERGDTSVMDFIEAIAQYVKRSVEENKTATDEGRALFPSEKPKGEIICKCPRCGNDVVETQKAFGCSARACKYVIFKESKFFTAKKKKLTLSIAKALMKEGKIKLSGLHSEKSAKTYDAIIGLVEHGDADRYPDLKILEFVK
jgi:DNA topoisomerase-3